MGCYQSNISAMIYRATNIMINSVTTLNSTSILTSITLFNMLNTNVILIVQKWIKLIELIFCHNSNYLNNPLPDHNSQPS